MCYSYSDERTESYGCLFLSNNPAGFWRRYSQDQVESRHCACVVYHNCKTGIRLNLGHACCTGNIKSYNVLGHAVLLALYLRKVWRWLHCFLEEAEVKIREEKKWDICYVQNKTAKMLDNAPLKMNVLENNLICIESMCYSPLPLDSCNLDN